MWGSSSLLCPYYWKFIWICTISQTKPIYTAIIRYIVKYLEMCLLLKVKTIKAWILSWYTTPHSLIICSKTIYQTGTFCFMLSRGVSSILLGLRQRMEREHFPAFFLLNFSKKILEKTSPDTWSHENHPLSHTTGVTFGKWVVHGMD